MITFEDVFTYDNLYDAARKCCNGVRWKTSVKKYEGNLVENISSVKQKLENGTYKSHKLTTFMLRADRGKLRKISAPHITDRPIQRCLCNNFLENEIIKKLIYNNGACIKDKGLDFSIQQLKKDLISYATNHKNEGYVLTVDFSKFFDSIDHEILLNKIDQLHGDDKIKKLYSYLISLSKSDKGLSLGNQVSHISALYYLNEIDHYIKEHLHIRYYGRYMDDCYLICDDKEHLKYCLSEIIRLSEKLKLNLNLKKTQIRKVKNFMFLNRHWYISTTGAVTCKLSKRTLIRLRRKYVYLEKNKPDALENFMSSIKGLEKQAKGVINYVCSKRECQPKKEY